MIRGALLVFVLFVDTLREEREGEREREYSYHILREHAEKPEFEIWVGSKFEFS